MARKQEGEGGWRTQLIVLCSQGNQFTGELVDESTALRLLNPFRWNGIFAILGSQAGTNEGRPASIATTSCHGRSDCLHVFGIAHDGVYRILQAMRQGSAFAKLGHDLGVRSALAIERLLELLSYHVVHFVGVLPLPVS